MNFCYELQEREGASPDELLETLNKHYEMVDKKTEFALETMLRLSVMIEEKRFQSLRAITMFNNKQKVRLRSIKKTSQTCAGTTSRVQYVMDWSSTVEKSSLPTIAKCEMPTPLGELISIRQSQKLVRDSLGVVINSNNLDVTRMVLNQHERMMAVLSSEQIVPLSETVMYTREQELRRKNQIERLY